MKVLAGGEGVGGLDVLLGAVPGPLEPGCGLVVSAAVLEGAGVLAGLVRAVEHDLKERGPAPPHTYGVGG